MDHPIYVISCNKTEDYHCVINRISIITKIIITNQIFDYNNITKNNNRNYKS